MQQFKRFKGFMGKEGSLKNDARLFSNPSFVPKQKGWILKLKHDSEYILRKYGSLVYKLAYARAGNKYDAEDISQDVFVRFIRHINEITNEEYAKAWLIRATVNRSNSLFSSVWRQRTQRLDDTITDENYD